MSGSFVLTGAAAVTALGRDLASTRAALAAGRSAAALVAGPGIPERPDPSPAVRIGAFTTEPEMPRAKARRLDLGSQYAVVAARQCLASAGWSMAGREERTGILIGSGSAGAGPLAEFERQMAVDSPESASPFLFPNTVANAPASVAAIELKIKGPNVTITQKDPASINALLYATLLLTDGRADAILVGAADEWNLTYHLAYERVRVTRTARRPGILMGEGAGLVLVETEEGARWRGARILARVAAVTMRGVPVSPQRRRGDATTFEAVMRDTLRAADLSPSDVAAVHLSRNGSPMTDEPETKAVDAIFGAPVPRLAVKETIGENPFAGGVQLALAAAALGDGSISGAVVVNGFGAGGNLLCCVLTPP